MNKLWRNKENNHFFGFIAPISTTVQAKSVSDFICTYAPSQSEVVKNISGAAGGAGATALAITKATGLTAVAHSSGAYIFTGSSGYVAGTLGGEHMKKIDGYFGVAPKISGQGQVEYVLWVDPHGELSRNPYRLSMP